MRHIFFLMAAFFAFSLQPVQAQPQKLMAIDLSAGEIDITTGFSGTSVVIFGVQNAPGDVVLTIRGPKQDMIVRQKQQILGFWINTDSMRFINVPGFYDFVANKGEHKIAAPEILEEKSIGIDYLRLRAKESDFDSGRRLHFEQALFQNMQYQSLFAKAPKTLTYISQDLFRTVLQFPSNVPTGVYHVDAYLFEAGEVKAFDSKRLIVKQVGFAAEVKNISRTHPLLYGIGVVLISLFLGLATTIIFKRD